MKENILWDKNISMEELKNILKDDSNPRFVYFASLILSRTGNIKEVLSNYLDKTIFCKNWRKIKRRMRKDKWSNKRIDFWDEVYRVTLEKTGKRGEISSKRDVFIEEGIKEEVKELVKDIRKTRKIMGLTQKELAYIVGLSQQTISFIEKGNFDFSFGSLMKILHALGLKISMESKDKYIQSVDSSTPDARSYTDISTAMHKSSQ